MQGKKIRSGELSPPHVSLFSFHQSSLITILRLRRYFADIPDLPSLEEDVKFSSRHSLDAVKLKRF